MLGRLGKLGDIPGVAVGQPDNDGKRVGSGRAAGVAARRRDVAAARRAVTVVIAVVRGVIAAVVRVIAAVASVVATVASVVAAAGIGRIVGGHKAGSGAVVVVIIVLRRGVVGAGVARIVRVVSAGILLVAVAVAGVLVQGAAVARLRDAVARLRDAVDRLRVVVGVGTQRGAVILTPRQQTRQKSNTQKCIYPNTVYSVPVPCQYT
jgi:hypothetical protein